MIGSRSRQEQLQGLKVDEGDAELLCPGTPTTLGAAPELPLCRLRLRRSSAAIKPSGPAALCSPLHLLQTSAHHCYLVRNALQCFIDKFWVVAWVATSSASGDRNKRIPVVGPSALPNFF